MENNDTMFIAIFVVVILFLVYAWISTVIDDRKIEKAKKEKEQKVQEERDERRKQYAKEMNEKTKLKMKHRHKTFLLILHSNRQLMV